MPPSPVAFAHGSLRAALALQPHGAQPQIETRAVGGWLLAALHGDAACGSVRPQGHGTRAFLALMLQVAGSQRLAPGACEVRSGELLGWGSHLCGEFEGLGRQQVLHLLVPADEWACAWPALAADARPRMLATGRPHASLAAAGLQALWAQRAAYDDVELQDALTALLDLLHAAQTRASAPADRRGALYQAALGDIERCLADPSLTPQALAQRHGCSLRTLHAAFAANGQTVAGLIRRRRLEHCRAQLEAGNAPVIGVLAERWGFVDAAHFSRVFKAAYGASPRAYRQRRPVRTA